MIHEDDKNNIQQYAREVHGLNLTDLQTEAVFNIVMFTPGGDLDVLLAFLANENIKRVIEQMRESKL